LAAGPWFAETWAVAGNPFFPRFTRLLGGPSWWDTRYAANLAAERAAPGHHGGPEGQRYGPAVGALSDWVLGPLWLVLRHEKDYGSPMGPGVGYLVLVPAVLLVRRRRALLGPLLLAAALYAAWMLGEQRLRLLLPGLVVAAAVAGMAAAGLRARAREPRVGPAALGVLLWAGVVWSATDQLRLQEPLAYGCGWQSAQEYLLSPNPLRDDRRPRVPYLRVAQYANDCLPYGANILFVGETRSYYFEVPCDAETGFATSTAVLVANRCRQAQQIPAVLRRLGYTHLLYDLAVVDEQWARRLGTLEFSDRAAVRRWADAVQYHMDPVYVDEGVCLFALEEPWGRR